MRRIVSRLNRCYLRFVAAVIAVSTVTGIVPTTTAGTQSTQNSAVKGAIANRDDFVFDLLLPEKADDRIELMIPLEGRITVAVLTRTSIRGPDYSLSAQAEDGSWRTVDPGPDLTYSGRIAELPEARIAASLLEDGLHARIRLSPEDDRWIEPANLGAPRSATAPHRIHREADPSVTVETCGGPTGPAWMPGNGDGIPRGSCSPVCVADIACDADVGFFQHNGSSVVRAQNAILSTLHAVNLQYAAEVGITHRVTRILVRTAEPDPYESDESNALLCEFINEWELNQIGVPRDLAILFSYNFVAPSGGQAAAIGSVCAVGASCDPVPTAGAYCFVNAVGGFVSGFVAHQLGHLWGASDCDCPGTTMDDGWPGNTFIGAGSNSVAEISAFRDSATCLDSSRPVNDDCLSATAISASGVYVGSSVGATTDGTASCGADGSAGFADVWWQITPTASGMLLIDACGSSFDAIVSLHYSCPPNQSEIACGADCSNCGATECVYTRVVANTPLYIRVAGVNGAAGDVVLRILLPCTSLARPFVTATDGTVCDAVRLTWNPVAGASSYRMFRQATAPGSPEELVGAPASSPFDDTTAVPGASYYYSGIAVGACGTSAYTSTNVDTGYRGPPAGPTGVLATTGSPCDRIRVSWNSVSGATAYEIWRGPTSDISGATLLATDNASPYEDMTTDPQIEYWYWVRALHSCGPTSFGGPTHGYHGAPPPPTSVRASDGQYCERVNVSWLSFGATSYSVWRAEVDDPAAPQQIGTSTYSFFDDTTAQLGVTYYYFVTAANSCGQSAMSGSDAGYRRGPSAPTSVNATNGSSCSYVRVTWSYVPTTTAYHVWRSATNDLLTATQIGAPPTTTFDDTSAVSGTVYYYWVRATNSCWTSEFSNPAARGFRGPPPFQPTNVAASDGAYCLWVRITWTPADSATQYDIRRATVDNFSSSLVIATRSGTTFDDTSAAPGIPYYYWVVSRNSCGAGAVSSADPGFRAAAPVPPASVVATTGLCDRVVVSWSMVSDATSYEVWRGTSSNSGSSARLTSWPSSPFEDRSAIPGMTYYYWVRSVNSCGLGVFGAPATGSRGAAPAPPTNVLASNSNTCAPIRVTWNASPDATSYQIWRNNVSSPQGAVLVGTDDTSPFDDDTVESAGYYFVLGLNDCGVSSFGNPDFGSHQTVPPPPPWIAASDGLCPLVAITWGPVGPASYQVWRGETSDVEAASLIGTTAQSVSHFEDYVADAGLTYYYWVRSVGACGVSSAGGPDSGFRHCDCNGNGVEDIADISAGTSADCDSNDVPDECECPEDISRDGLIDLSDLALLLAHFGESDSACVAVDIDRNDSINLQDLALVLARFGTVCE
ncbi:MAG: hypothetical protein JNG88_12380 [Phycisphaerales bacterium]|nr:hypothetical protein [Phycisphaerales bacterium]